MLTAGNVEEQEFINHIKRMDEIGFEIKLYDLMNYHNNIWTSGTRKQYPLSTMSKEYLVSCIYFVSESSNTTVAYGLGKVWLRKLKKELGERNE